MPSWDKMTHEQRTYRGLDPSVRPDDQVAVDRAIRLIRDAKRKRGFNADLTSEELDRLLPPVNCRRTRDRLRNKGQRTMDKGPHKNLAASAAAACDACGGPARPTKDALYEAFRQTDGWVFLCATCVPAHRDAYRAIRVPAPASGGRSGRFRWK
jgi:hypothetical protein